MAIRLPLQTVLATVGGNEIGAGSVAGGIPLTFTIPQDTDNIVVKFRASTVSGGLSATFQTTDDGGTTWYDVQRTSVVSNANATTAEWLSIPVLGQGQRSNVSIGSVVATGSVVANGAIGATIGSAAASSLGVNQASGLPVLSQFGRVFVRIAGNVTSAASNSYNVDVKVNSQSPTA